MGYSCVCGSKHFEGENCVTGKTRDLTPPRDLASTATHDRPNQNARNGRKVKLIETIEQADGPQPGLERIEALEALERIERPR